MIGSPYRFPVQGIEFVAVEFLIHFVDPVFELFHSSVWENFVIEFILGEI